MEKLASLEPMTLGLQVQVPRSSASKQARLVAFRLAPLNFTPVNGKPPTMFGQESAGDSMIASADACFEDILLVTVGPALWWYR
jgi:hypothetical protein